MTEAEARALGIAGVKPAHKRTTRKTAPGPWHTRCWTCKVEFTTEASEDRHVTDTHHARYDNVIVVRG